VHRPPHRPPPSVEGEPLVRRGRPWPMGCGLLLAVLTLFMAPATLRYVCAELNRDDYVADELELESRGTSSRPASASAPIATT
jgi:hypothetical protein